MNYNREPIHKLDRVILIKAFLIGAAIEDLAIAPAILSPWGPLDGRWSDLTATFDVLQIGEELVLRLDEIHVM